MRALFIPALLGVVLVALGSLMLGPVHLPPGEVFSALLGSSTDQLAQTVVLSIRLPRVLAALMVGAGLSSAGVAMQAFFRNPLADPWLIGVAPGATLGAVVALVSGASFTLWGITSLPLFAFLGGLGLAVLVTLFATRRGGEVASVDLLLMGVALGSVASALASWLLISTGTRFVGTALSWITGSLDAVRWPTLTAALWVFLVGLGLLAVVAPRLDYLILPTEEARSMGVPVVALRWSALISAALLTGAAVAVAGVVAFVGLIVPHTVRILVGGVHRRLVPFALLAGAGFMVLVDTLARTVTTPGLPLSLVTSVVGVPFFIYLLRSRGVREW